MPILAAFLFIFALVLLALARQRRKAIGLPAGRIIYADTHKWTPTEEPLYDPELGLTGRPDYLVEDKGKVIPVEVKSTRISAAPYDAHIFQLAAYCRLVQRHFGKRPDYGILHYTNRTFAVDYTPQLERALLDLLDEIRAQDKKRESIRSHDSVARCSRCGFRIVCDQRLM
jgi:CRISPR-associated exonuclease Cas4